MKRQHYSWLYAYIFIAWLTFVFAILRNLNAIEISRELLYAPLAVVTLLGFGDKLIALFIIAPLNITHKLLDQNQEK